MVKSRSPVEKDPCQNVLLFHMVGPLSAEFKAREEYVGTVGEKCVTMRACYVG